MLEHSREFIVLARRLNYTAAAFELNISQPSLSRHMAELEREVGFRLLERNPVALTPAGQYYLKRISAIIDDLDSTLETGMAIADEDRYALSICMIPSACPYSDTVYAAIARMRDESELFTPTFCTDRSHTIYESVASGKSDVGILLAEPDSIPDGFACEWLIDTQFNAWIHEDNPVLGKRPVAFEDLADYHVLCSTNQLYSTWKDGMLEAFHQKGIEPKLHLRDIADLNGFFVELAPDEIVLGSDPGVETSRYNRHLVGVTFDDPTLFYSAYLFYRKESAKPVLKRFVDVCHRVAEEA